MVIFQNWQGLSSEALMYPTVRGSNDRFEADQGLLEFYHGNVGAQNVVRLIKYATYMEAVSYTHLRAHETGAYR
eukprot:4506481-Pyramimonas_sp.AAC.1